jgi:prepilin-type N-terminal cleavage/methylation domain-containing protein/prepilin-type processing-associated H-X9-DG protein
MGSQWSRSRGRPVEHRGAAGPRSQAARLPIQGFTLIELLSVICIIAVLVGILVPTLAAARRRATAVSCQARIREWGLALQMYIGDSHGRWMSASTGEATTGVSGVPWLGVTLPFWESSGRNKRPNAWGPGQMIESRIAMCPATKVNRQVPFNANPAQVVVPDWGTDTFVFSYGFNAWLYLGRETVPVRKNVCGCSARWGTCDIRGAANIPVLGDCLSVEPYVMHNEAPPEIEGSFGRTWAGQPYTEWGSWCINRHGGGINMLFMDWSVRKVGCKELWTLKWHRQFDTAGRWTSAGGVRPEDWPEWMRGFKDF